MKRPTEGGGEVRLREVASGLAFPEGPVAMDDGSLLVTEIASGDLTRITADGRKHRIAHLGGGPNGAAIGPDGAVYVCNNGGMEFSRADDGSQRPGYQPAGFTGGWLERVDLSTGRSERLVDAVDGVRLRGPNDLVFDAHGGCYFTDLGKVRPTEVDRGGVYYLPAGADRARAIAAPAMTPNGIGLSPDGAVLYYAETEGARIWAFDVVGPGEVRRDAWPSPHGGRMLVASPGGQYQRFDSMALDVRGNLYVGTLLHGGVTVISPDGREVRHVPMPDRYPTNVCFGGEGMRTMFVTLSGTGRVVALDGWGVAGLRLGFGG